MNINCAWLSGTAAIGNHAEYTILHYSKGGIHQCVSRALHRLSSFPLLIGMTSFPFVLMRRTSQAVFRTRRTGRDVVWDQETEKKL